VVYNGSAENAQSVEVLPSNGLFRHGKTGIQSALCRRNWILLFGSFLPRHELRVKISGATKVDVGKRQADLEGQYVMASKLLVIKCVGGGYGWVINALWPLTDDSNQSGIGDSLPAADQDETQGARLLWEEGSET
jgi:hypothetical protein